MALEDIEAEASAIVGEATAGAATDPDKITVPDRVWIGGGNAPYAGQSAAPGAGGATARDVTTSANIIKLVYGWAASNPTQYMAYAQQLVNAGALYDMRYARNVNTVIEATQRALVMYGNGSMNTPFPQWLSTATMGDESGSSSGGGSGYGGPAAPQPADPSAIRRAYDQVTTNLLGRTLRDEEFDKYYKSYTSDFSSNPDMDPAQHMIESARTEDDYQEYQVATKFAGALESVLKGSI